MQKQKHVVVKPETHQKLKVAVAEKNLKSADELINHFLEGEDKHATS